MTTPGPAPRPGLTPNPENAPTAPPPPMLHLMRRRKAQVLLRRRNLVPAVEKPVAPVAPASEGAPSDSAELDALRAELKRDREARRSAEALAASANALAARLQGELATVTQDAENHKRRAEDFARQFEEAKAFVARARADMDHQRKRLQKEKEDSQRYAAEETLRELFPVLDNFTYAIELTEQGRQDLESLAKGMVMVFRELKVILGRAGLEAINQTGVPFDPHIHDAASAVSDPTLPNGVVVAILRPGYRLGEKVLRPAMVSVNKVDVVAPPEDETALPTAPPTPAEPNPSPATEDRLSGLTPLDRARRMLDTKF